MFAECTHACIKCGRVGALSAVGIASGIAKEGGGGGGGANAPPQNVVVPLLPKTPINIRA